MDVHKRTWASHLHGLLKQASERILSFSFSHMFPSYNFCECPASFIEHVWIWCVISVMIYVRRSLPYRFRNFRPYRAFTKETLKLASLLIFSNTSFFLTLPTPARLPGGWPVFACFLTALNVGVGKIINLASKVLFRIADSGWSWCGKCIRMMLNYPRPPLI